MTEPPPACPAAGPQKMDATIMFKVGRRKKTGNSRIRKASDFYRSEIYGQSELWAFPHPNHDLWLRNKLLNLARKRLSTECISLLEELYDFTRDPFTRKMLARKIHLLRVDYLSSFKEHSDRGLIRLVEREGLFDRWEGIYILGYFGGDEATKYLRGQLALEQNCLLTHAIEQALIRIKKKKAEKARLRGF